MTSKKLLAEALKDQGNSALQSGDVQRAIQLYTSAINEYPENHVIHSNRAAAYLQIKKYEDAERDARTAAKLEPLFSKGWYRLGQALFGLAKYQESINAFSEALKLEPNNSQFQNALAQAKSKAPSASSATSSTSSASPRSTPSTSFASNKDEQKELDSLFAEMASMKIGGGQMENTLKVMQMAMQMLSQVVAHGWNINRQQITEYLASLSTPELEKIYSGASEKLSFMEKTTGPVTASIKKYAKELVTKRIDKFLKFMESFAYIQNLETQGTKMSSILDPMFMMRNPEHMLSIGPFLEVQADVMPLEKQKSPVFAFIDFVKCISAFIGEAHSVWTSRTEKLISKKELKRAEKNKAPSRKKKRHCEMCPTLDDSSIISTSLPSALVDSLVQQVSQKSSEAMTALKRLSLDSEACQKILQPPCVQVVKEMLNNETSPKSDIFLVLANLFAHDVEDDRYKTPSKDVEQIVSSLAAFVNKDPSSNLTDVIARAVANIAYSSDHYGSLLKSVLPALRQSVLKNPTEFNTRAAACLASVPALAKSMFELGFLKTMLDVAVGPPIGSAALANAFAISARDYLTIHLDTRTTTNEDMSILDVKKSTQPSMSCFHPTLKTKWSNGNAVIELLSKQDFVSACDGYGVMKLFGVKKFPGAKEQAFVALLINVLTGEIRSSMMHMFLPHEKEKVIQYIKHYMRSRSYVQEEVGAYVPISKQQVSDIVQLAMQGTKRPLDKEELSITILFEADKSKIKCKTLQEYLLENMGQPVRSKDFSWWRDFIRSDFFYNYSFHAGDLIGMGAKHTAHGTFQPTAINCATPTPIPKPAKEWIMTTLSVAAQDPLSLLTMAELFAYMSFFFKLYGSSESEEISKDMAFNVKHIRSLIDNPSGKLADSPLAVAYIERSNYFSGMKYVNVEMMMSSYRRHGLEQTLSELLSNSINAVRIKHIPRYSIFDEVAKKVMTSFQAYTARESFSGTAFSTAYRIAFEEVANAHKEVDFNTLIMLSGITQSNALMLLERIWPEMKKSGKLSKPAPMDPLAALNSYVSEMAKPTQISEQERLRYTKNVCANCSSYAPTQCSRCKKVYYCSRECQKEHWKEHKAVCVAPTTQK